MQNYLVLNRGSPSGKKAVDKPDFGYIPKRWIKIVVPWPCGCEVLFDYMAKGWHGQNERSAFWDQSGQAKTCQNI